MVNFRGFTTNNRKIGATVLENRALALADLNNAFHTQRGERLGRPDFGSILPLLVFEQDEIYVESQAEDDIRQIVENDPRWKLIDISIDTSDHHLTANVQLIYVVDSTPETLVLHYSGDNIT